MIVLRDHSSFANARNRFLIELDYLMKKTSHCNSGSLLLNCKVSIENALQAASITFTKRMAENSSGKFELKDFSVN